MKQSHGITRLNRRGVCTLFSGLAAGLLWRGTAQAQTATIDVTVFFRERIMLPPNAEVLVELLDVSRADAPSITLASKQEPISGVPYSTQLAYDPADIDQRFTYTVAARITAGNRVLFRTTTAYPVLTRGASDKVEVMLQMAADPATTAPVEDGMTGTVWEAFEIGGRALISETPPTFAIDEAGAVSLFAGCNMFAGQADLGEGTIAFPRPFAGTMKACPETLSRLESDVLDAVSKTARYTLNGDLLVLSNENDLALVRFRRQAE
ncbi:YbaY family lipoprotein [Albibacillus kandeliae]|uniref:YbaY family lipoprotein n=1 Tax=Albibacillus kandeliae TaxID=2174228 RepID=UPI000D68928D|nr:YbaY family lipoprotein [Albibacillus kandeliae]